MIIKKKKEDILFAFRLVPFLLFACFRPHQESLLCKSDPSNLPSTELFPHCVIRTLCSDPWALSDQSFEAKIYRENVRWDTDSILAVQLRIAKASHASNQDL